jgi:hypothetical protein
MPNKLEKKILFLSPKTSYLKPVIGQLLSVLQDYIDVEADDQDIPFWYGERAHIGFFAGAIWRCGGVALEEYIRARTRGVRKGRCDLYVKLGRNSFECEAKRVVSLKDVDKKLGMAMSDITCVLDPGEKGLALTFFTPRLEKAQLAGYRDHLARWMKVLMKNRNKWDGVVWIGFRKGQEFPKPDTQFPGLFLIIKAVKKPHRIGKAGSD